MKNVLKEPKTEGDEMHEKSWDIYQTLKDLRTEDRKKGKKDKTTQG